MSVHLYKRRWTTPKFRHIFGKVLGGSMPPGTFGEDGIRPSFAIFSTFQRYFIFFFFASIYLFFQRFLPGCSPL